MAACPLALISFQSELRPGLQDFLPGGRVVMQVDARDGLEDRAHAGHALGEPRLHLLEEDVGVVEAAIHEVDGLALERVEPGGERLARDLRGEADRVQGDDLLVCSHGILLL